MASIDPIRLAQFMVLPGAAELVEAFASLPPGEIRDSVVAHAQVLARAHVGWTPPFEMAQVVVTEPPKPPKRLASPFAEGLQAKSAEGQIVERALRGEPLHQIAADLGVPLGLVVGLVTRARREGGVVFPGDDKPAKQAKKPAKGGKITAMPIPPPPYWWQDPDSPVWENPRLLPTLSEAAVGSLAFVGPMDVRAYRVMTVAGARRGLTLRQYVAQRLEMIRRAEAGEEVRAVAEAYGLLPQYIYKLLGRIGRPWMQSVLDRANAAPGQLASTPSAQLAQQSAAIKWGFRDIEHFTQARERVRELRGQGLNPMRIATVMDAPIGFVRGAVAYWKARGEGFDDLRARG